MRAIGIPLDMFTVMFAIGRMPGWIANWKEVWEGQSRIYRPRQVYVGPTERELRGPGRAPPGSGRPRFEHGDGTSGLPMRQHRTGRGDQAGSSARGIW